MDFTACNICYTHKKSTKQYTYGDEHFYGTSPY
jgi:hypothetical protein